MPVAGAVAVSLACHAALRCLLFLLGALALALVAVLWIVLSVWFMIDMFPYGLD
jgi:hypothetical protein